VQQLQQAEGLLLLLSLVALVLAQHLFCWHFQKDQLVLLQEVEELLVLLPLVLPLSLVAQLVSELEPIQQLKPYIYHQDELL
jgi:hypothetical protein